MSQATEATSTPPEGGTRKANNAGTFVGLGLAVAGFALALIPLIGVIGWPLMIAGLVLGIIGAAKKWQPMWANIVNIVLGFVGPGLAIVLVSAGLLAGSDASTPSSSNDEPTTSEQAETTEAEEQETGEFAVTIDGARTGTDYAGEPILIVTYTFTNNGEEPQTFMWAFSDKAFQNGVELDGFVVSDEVDSVAKTKELKPGATIEVQSAFALDDQSEVTVEVSELWSLSDKIIASQVFSVV